MGSVEIFDYPDGIKLEKVIAMHVDVQDALDKHAGFRGMVASGVLAAHRHEGHSEIRVEKIEGLEYGSIDRFVVLDDTRGLLAAMTIEFGRKDKPGRPGMRGVAPLRKAFGLVVG